jgi:dienelactone hydrolase
MGGALSLALASQAAVNEMPLQAAVSCYGIPPADAFDVTKITNATPIQGHFGGKVVRNILQKGRRDGHSHACLLLGYHGWFQ